MELEHKELTEKIIGAVIHHQLLGPGFIESIYEKALVIELRKCGLQEKGNKTSSFEWILIIFLNFFYFLDYY